MKRNYLKVLVLLLIIIICLVGLFACDISGEGGNRGNKISFKTLSVNADNSAYIKVANTQTTFSFVDEIEVSGDATYFVSMDIFGMQQVPTKMVSLEIGDNTFYVTENVGKNVKTYTITIRRRPIYTVTFNTNGGTSVDSQQVEENSFAVEPTTTRVGYTFAGWNYDFNEEITKDTTITANWIRSYSIVINSNNADAGMFTDYSGLYTYGEKIDLVATTFLGYKWCGWYSGKDLVSTNPFLEVVVGQDAIYTATWEINDDLNNFYFTSTEDTLTINGIKDKSFTEIIVPSYVTHIALGAFSDCDKVEKMTVPFVGNRLNGMSDAHIGYIFGATSVFDNGSYVPSSLKEVIVTSGNAIGNFAFMYCDLLTNIIIPDSVQKIGYEAFYGCRSLTNIKIPDLVKTIEGYAFGGCNSLTNIVIPDSVKTIEEYAFEGCNSLQSIYIGSGVKTIGKNAFNRCVSLISVKIPDSVKTIEEYAFNGCDSLQSVYIGSGLTSVEADAFMECKSLIEINVDEKNSYYKSIDGNLYSKDGKVLIQYVARNSGEKFIIPDSVISIEEYAFYKKNILYEEYDNGLYVGNKDNPYLVFVKTKSSQIENCIINSNCKFISCYSFANCSSLKTIEMPDSIISIGYNAFLGCNNLIKVCYDGTVDGWCEINFSTEYSNPLSYGAELYINNNKLTKVEITTSTRISNYAFCNCNFITSVEIGNSVKSIDKYSFYDCTSIEKMTIPFVGGTLNGTENMYLGYIFGAGTYNGDNSNVPSSLKEVIITGGNSIGKYAFYNCKFLTNIVIENGVQFIEDYAFFNCDCLTNIVIGNDVESIGSNAFSNCTSLASVVIPNNVESIGDNAFSGCKSLVSVEIPNNITTIKSGTFGACTSLTSVKIPNNVTSIGDYAFSNCTSLASVEIQDQVEIIGEHAFEACEFLTYNIYDNGLYLGNSKNPYVVLIKAKSEDITNCTINDNCKIINSFAFQNCKSLKKVVMPNGIIDIGNYAFYHCTALEEFTIPNGVKHIGYDVFSGCKSMVNVTIPDSEMTMSGDIFEYCESLDYNEYDNGLYLGNSENPYIILVKAKSTIITTCKINTNCKYINSSAFEGCSLLKSVSLPNNIRSIGESAFLRCSSLENIVIPNGITRLERFVFYECRSLKSVKIPSSVTSIGDGVFYGCSSLTSIEIPDSVVSVGYEMFYGCLSLESVKISDNITEFGSYFFRYCGSLRDITMPNSLKSIGPYAFEGCNSLTNIVIPNSVEVIKVEAFKNCISLTSIVIPEKLLNVESGVFSGCGSLDKIYFKGNEEAWKKMTIIDSYISNVKLLEATCYYYSEIEPQDEGDYWHYDTDGVTILKWTK